MCNYYRGFMSAHPGSNPQYPAPKSGVGVKSPYKKIKQVICKDRRAPVVVVNTSLDRLASPVSACTWLSTTGKSEFFID
jgi:hypothetical protein